MKIQGQNEINLQGVSLKEDTKLFHDSWHLGLFPVSVQTSQDGIFLWFGDGSHT